MTFPLQQIVVKWQYNFKIAVQQRFKIVVQ